MCILPLAFPPFFETFIFAPLHLFSGMEEVTEGAAPVDQSAKEGPEGISIDPTSSPSCPPDISQSPPPYSPSIIPLYSSPPTISPITISPDIPIRVEYQILLLYLLLSFFIKAILPLCLLSVPLLS